MTQKEFLQHVHSIQSALLRSNQFIDLIELRNCGEGDNMVSPDAATLIVAFDGATNKIAARIQKLVDKSTSMSDEDKAAFQAEVTKLNDLGADPSDPIPASV